jgi:hypothetical protein
MFFGSKLIPLPPPHPHTHKHTHKLRPPTPHPPTHTSFEFSRCWSLFAKTLHYCAHADVRRWPLTGDAERHILQLLVETWGSRWGRMPILGGS